MFFLVGNPLAVVNPKKRCEKSEQIKNTEHILFRIKNWQYIFFVALFWVGAGKVCCAQTPDSTLKELAYWRKHPAEWKSYKATCLQKKQAHEAYLDSLRAYKDHRQKLQEFYDKIAERIERADSLLPLYEAQKKALIREKIRQKHNLTFKIQLQTAQKHEIDAFELPNTALTIEQAGKQKRYLVGKFRHYEEAQAFTEVLRNAGASAYIVAYKNGIRLNDFSAYLD